MSSFSHFRLIPSDGFIAEEPIDFFQAVVSVGRDPDSDLLISTAGVSDRHARLIRKDDGFWIEDLGSSQGTFLNDRRLTQASALRSGDRIRFGFAATFFYQELDGDPQRNARGHPPNRFDPEAKPPVEATGLGLNAIHLNRWVRKDLKILNDVSLVIHPGEFVAIVGQSGGGKSTLVDAISGYRPATEGKVVVNGLDIYQHFDPVRNDIGFVPQRNIIHKELTVYQALDYAARLRMAPKASPQERKQRVMEVMHDLDLTHRKDIQISSLSGGQQKRVSIGVELLTRPGLFFLDEPTSGLDPGTETALMQLLRRLADQGQTIILITHVTRNVLLADKVVFMARGGNMTWFGPPEEALDYFDRFRTDQDRRTGPIRFDDIYAILEDESKGCPEDWAKRYQESPAAQRYIARPLGNKAQPSPGLPVSAQGIPTSGNPLAASPQKVSSLQQFRILFSRNLRILSRDPFNLILLLVAPALIGLLDLLFASLLGRNPFDPTSGNARSVLVSMFMLTLYSLMGGTLIQMREIVKEQEIYRRERLVVLRIFPYVFSKFCVAILLSIYQAAFLTGIHYVAFQMPGGVPDFLMIFAILTIACLASMMLGLFVSALAPSAVSAPLLLLLVVLPHLVLNGGLVAAPPSISEPIFTHWTLQGLMGVSGIGSDVAADPCWRLSQDVRGMMIVDQKIAFGCHCLGPALFQPGTCNFPGLGQFHTPAVDRPAPAAPPPLGPPPAEPVLPPQPIEPANKSDLTAMADYLAKAKAWQSQVLQIQDGFKRDMQAYQKQASIYNAEMSVYQQARAQWEFAREAAVRPAEALIQDYQKNYGWTLVNKNDPSAYTAAIATSLLGQGAFVVLAFGLILLLQKLKDTIS